MKKLTEKEKLFLKYYNNPDNRETFGNGTKSVLAAYSCKNENAAAVYAVKILRKDKVKRYMAELNTKFELDMGKHIQGISEIATSVIDEVKNSKKKLSSSEVVSLLEKITKPVRFLAEYNRDIGPAGGVVALQVNFAGGKMDLSKMGLFDLENIKKQIEEEINTKWGKIESLGGFKATERVLQKKAEEVKEETTESIVEAVRSLKDL
jgi:hypothetical protein